SAMSFPDSPWRRSRSPRSTAPIPPTAGGGTGAPSVSTAFALWPSVSPPLIGSGQIPDEPLQQCPDALFRLALQQNLFLMPTDPAVLNVDAAQHVFGRRGRKAPASAHNRSPAGGPGCPPPRWARRLFPTRHPGEAGPDTPSAGPR